MDRKQWFLDRIGKRIFRNGSGCSCNVCANVYENGLIIRDAYHAEYLCDIEGEYNHEGYPLEYFDTKEEVTSFENEHNLPHTEAR
jgi:hypothetical protein